MLRYIDSSCSGSLNAGKDQIAKDKPSQAYVGVPDIIFSNDDNKYCSVMDTFLKNLEIAIFYQNI